MTITSTFRHEVMQMWKIHP